MAECIAVLIAAFLYALTFNLVSIEWFCWNHDFMSLRYARILMEARNAIVNYNPPMQFVLPTTFYSDWQESGIEPWLLPRIKDEFESKAVKRKTSLQCDSFRRKKMSCIHSTCIKEYELSFLVVLEPEKARRKFAMDNQQYGYKLQHLLRVRTQSTNDMPDVYFECFLQREPFY